jgi:hypothetical protein
MNLKTKAMVTDTEKDDSNFKSVYSIPGIRPCPEIEPSTQQIQEANLSLWVVVGLDYGGVPTPASDKSLPGNMAGLVVIGLLSSSG